MPRAPKADVVLVVGYRAPKFLLPMATVLASD
jgi:hypothetical protein